MGKSMQHVEPALDAAAVIRAADGLGRELSPRQAEVITGYLELLCRWRRKINLVGPTDWPTMLAALVADSWHLADFLTGPEAQAVLPEKGAPLCLLDFGAGAGLPGIPLRAFYPGGEYVLLESRAKRAIFLGEALDRLGLPGTLVAEGRVEATVPPILAARPGVFTLCLGRAFAPWPRFLAICRELVRPPMAVVTMTGEAPEAEVVPPGFILAARTEYPAPGRPRYLSLFSPVAASR
jgi:16S rRNA (guanine527-N7)-methyltransferase